MTHSCVSHVKVLCCVTDKFYCCAVTWLIHVCHSSKCQTHITMVSFAEYRLFYRALLQKIRQSIVLCNTSKYCIVSRPLQKCHMSSFYLRKVFCDMTRRWLMRRDSPMTHSALRCDSSMSLETPPAESVLWHDSSMTLPTWLFDDSWCAVIRLINVSRNTIWGRCSATWLMGRDLSMTHQCL